MRYYEQNVHRAKLAVASVDALYQSSKDLQNLTHSTRWRIKSADSMERKLIRKAREAVARGASFDITTENFFDRITDCAGFRILHLHTMQFERINAVLQALFVQQSYKLFEPTFARVWDLEYRDYFSRLDVRVEDSQSYYTSVHYVVDFNNQLLCKCEVQVRTLAEELWGEVNHSINYPETVDFLPCEEQLKALARSTSACTRLVDAIYRSYEAKPLRTRLGRRPRK
jgi:ppGpp synthetase/RelA/SpoT-type nucleotidyltranferase